jgi:hypothetical protein
MHKNAIFNITLAGFTRPYTLKNDTHEQHTDGTVRARQGIGGTFVDPSSTGNTKTLFPSDNVEWKTATSSLILKLDDHNTVAKTLSRVL